MAKTQISTVLEFDGVRGIIVKNESGYVKIRWLDDSAGSYRTGLIERDTRWRIIGVEG
jgi:hypothetical protein